MIDSPSDPTSQVRFPARSFHTISHQLSTSINQLINQWICIRRLKFNISYYDDSEAPVSHSQPKSCGKRCPFSRRKNWGCGDAPLTADGKLFVFQTLGAEMQIAGVVVIFWSMERYVGYHLINPESERVDVGWCVREDKMAAAVVELVRHCGEFVSYSTHLMTGLMIHFTSVSAQWRLYRRSVTD